MFQNTQVFTTNYAPVATSPVVPGWAGLAGLLWIVPTTLVCWVSLTPIPERQSLKVGNTLFHTPLSTGRTVIIIIVVVVIVNVPPVAETD